ncbi:MAG: hypothetical protein ACRDQ4_17870 [Pseudonocardiaceae bacterium]
MSARPFAATSPLNQPIGRDPVLDPNNERMIAGLISAGPAPVADLYEFGFGIYNADASTPRRTVTCRITNWGKCPFAGMSVPLTVDMVPPKGSDGQISVIDWPTRTVYEMWQYRWSDGHPSASWGALTSYDGDGFTRPPYGSGSSRGSGFAVLAGVIRTYEIRRGEIRHALEFSTSKCQRGVFRAPASTTDGMVDSPDAIPEGTRVQLDPSLDLDAIPGITAGEKIVGRALQIYGAYNVDCGGAPMAIGFELPHPGLANTYPAVGLTYDYYRLRHIPFSKFRVLATWDTGSAP